MSEKLEKIKELQRFTNAGLVNCKQALEKHDGDMFEAMLELLTEEDVLEKSQSLLVRKSAGNSIKDPVTPAEEDLISRLKAHFVRERTRSHHIAFSQEVLPYGFLTDADFRTRLLIEPVHKIVHQIWEKIGHEVADFADAAGLAAVNAESPTGVCTVVTMPPPQSEWECHYLVLHHGVPRLFRKAIQRAFVIFSLTNKTDAGPITIAELVRSASGLKFGKKHWLEEVQLEAKALSEAVLDKKAKRVG